MPWRSSVLILDDETAIRDIIAYELSLEGYRTETAETCADALHLIKRHRFELAIIELPPSAADARAMVQAFVAADETIKLIVTTSDDPAETAWPCIRAGAHGYLRKPYRRAELLLAVGKALRQGDVQPLVALHDTSHTLLASLDERDLLDTIPQLAIHALGADAAGIRRSEPHSPTSWHTSDHGATALLMSQLAARALGPATLFCGHDMPDHADPPFGSALVYALTNRGRKLGTLIAVRAAQAPRFTDAELDRGRVLATSVALSVDNSRLDRELRLNLNELAATRAKLRQAERYGFSGDLAKGLAHALNNPLTYLRLNLAELIASAITVHDDAPESVRFMAELLEETADGLERIADMVNALDHLALPPDTKETTITTISPVLEQTLRSVTPSPITEGMQPDLSANISAADLRTVLNTLLQFVRRAAHPQLAPVQVQCRRNAEWSRIDITVPALFLDEDERVRLFHPQVQDSPGQPLQLDLSMAIAQRLVQRVGGELSVVASDDGTAFRITLRNPDQGAQNVD